MALAINTGAITSLAFTMKWRNSQRSRFGQILKVFAKGLASEADEAAIGEFR
jgi:hypothetical protein